jgi:hypothetical protein
MSSFSLFAADETVKEKIQESMRDSKRAVKQTDREFEDKTCELVNGKMVCALKKIKHTAEKSADKIQDAAD